jgi:hypothetical protein
MTFKKTLFTAALLASTAMSAQAAEIVKSGATIGYGSASSDAADDSNGMFVKGGATVDFGGIDLDLNAAYGDVGADETATILSAAPSMELTPAMKVGGFFDYSMIDSANKTHYGATGEYEMPALSISGYAGMGKDDVGDSTVYGAALNYDLPGNLDAGAFYDAENTDLVDNTQVGARVGYDMSMFSVPVYASASYATVANGVDEKNVMGISLSIPMGSGASDKGQKRFSDRSVIMNQAYLSE